MKDYTDNALLKTDLLEKGRIVADEIRDVFVTEFVCAVKPLNVWGTPAGLCRLQSMKIP